MYGLATAHLYRGRVGRSLTIFTPGACLTHVRLLRPARSGMATLKTGMPVLVRPFQTAAMRWVRAQPGQGALELQRLVDRFLHEALGSGLAPGAQRGAAEPACESLRTAMPVASIRLGLHPRRANYKSERGLADDHVVAVFQRLTSDAPVVDHHAVGAVEVLDDRMRRTCENHGMMTLMNFASICRSLSGVTADSRLASEHVHNF